MNPGKTDLPKEIEVQSELAHALANLNCDKNQALFEKTRRVMHDTALALDEHRVRQRRNTAFALVAALSLLVLLSPAVWNGLEDLVGGESFSDLPIQVSLYLLMLFPAMLAALIAVWSGHRNMHNDGRGL